MIIMKVKTVYFLFLLSVFSFMATLLWPTDRFNWPESGEKRIDEMARILHRIKGPARWCSASRNPLSVATQHRLEVKNCMAKIEATSLPFIAARDGALKQFWSAREAGFVCEVTLATVKGNNRVVGSDCYYGLFHGQDYEAEGMTDDPFG
ncbi:MAG: hypothetical protein ACRBBQ_17230 [Cognatishimia sp.]